MGGGFYYFTLMMQKKREVELDVGGTVKKQTRRLRGPDGHVMNGLELM